ncbi:plasmid mobilization relaxosome protein MobC [Sulfuriferula thiophila]|uniref:plasmid mobilization relaxosome protein MobC n=1 Tax=Sulfuriferula thiophila TaxID=1781211 RepID=UPI000F612958|nr:plasmid mobilization relaxosome protein MobC [Sulfuriferula thiophila]
MYKDNDAWKNRSHKSIKSREFTVSLPLALADQLVEMSESTGMSYSAVLRRAFVDMPILTERAETTLAQMRSDLSRVGANLNQIAKRLNQYADVTQSEIDETLSEVKFVVTSINFQLRP